MSFIDKSIGWPPAIKLSKRPGNLLSLHDLLARWIIVEFLNLLQTLQCMPYAGNPNFERNLLSMMNFLPLQNFFLWSNFSFGFNDSESKIGQYSSSLLIEVYLLVKSRILLMSRYLHGILIFGMLPIIEMCAHPIFFSLNFIGRYSERS